MTTEIRLASRRCATGWILCAMLTLGVGCGGGESVISGVGNSGNHIGAAALWGSLANQLAENPAVPRVTENEIARIYDVIREQAFEGDLEAAMVLLKLAEEQREDG